MIGKRGYACILLFWMWISSPLSFAEKIRCSTVEAYKQHVLRDPQTAIRNQQLENDIQQWIASNAGNRQTNAIITIPVVVHVVYHLSDENISDDQIQSQIQRLNLDFRKLNTDMIPSSNPFYPLAADAGIEFCLVQVDPDGNPTTGITRTYTDETEFYFDDDGVKFTGTGGIDAWDPTEYLNLWVCNLEPTLLGYAQYPSEFSSSPETDGVVIGSSNFGTTGTVIAPYDLGRTATHEIGHWLNLKHIWGDDEGESDECSGSDGVSDTPNQQVPTYDCPSGIKTDNCSPVNPGILYEDFMDYTDDACMVLFTSGQVTRMHAALAVARSTIVSSNKCGGATLVSQQAAQHVRIYPNPVENYLAVDGLPQTKSRKFAVEVLNMLGEKVFTYELLSQKNLMELPDLKTGTYVLHIYNDEFSVVQKISVVK